MKTSYFLPIVAACLAMSACSKTNQPEPLISKPGQTADKKALSALTKVQSDDFLGLMQDMGIVETTANSMDAAPITHFPQNKDSRTLSLENLIVPNCVSTSTDTTKNIASDKYELTTAFSDVTGKTCPIKMNISFAANPQGNGRVFKLNSTIEIVDPSVQALVDVTKQTMTGSGIDAASGADDRNEVIQFSAAGTVTSISRGDVKVQRNIQAKIHQMSGVTEDAQYEITDQFDFKNYSVLIQKVSVKIPHKPTTTSYYMNGEPLDQETYVQIMRHWGVQTAMVSKL